MLIMNHKNMPTKSTERSWIRIYWAIAGMFLFAASLLAFFRGHKGLVEIAIPLGLAMLFAGMINIIVYRKGGSSIHGSCWLLADGMTTALLSIFPLFNKMIQPAMIPFFFGVWELFSGVLKIIDSGELYKGHIQGWHWFMGIGIVEILSGVAALLKPVDEFVGMHAVVAIILMIQSCGFLFKIRIYPRLLIDSSSEHSSSPTDYT